LLNILAFPSLVVLGGIAMENIKNKKYEDVVVKLANQMDPESMPLTHILTTIVEQVANVMDVDQVSIWQFNPKNQEIRCSVLKSQTKNPFPHDWVDLAPSHYYRTALQTEQSIIVYDRSTDPRVVQLPSSYWLNSGVKTCLHVPIRAVNQVTGILRLDTIKERKWNPEEIQFCVQVSYLISQIFLSHELTVRSQHHETLRSFSTDITHHFNLLPTLNDLVRRSVEDLDCSYGVLFITDPDRSEVVPTASYNTPKEYTDKSYRFGEDVAGKVVETGKVLIIHDYRTWTGRSIKIVKKDEPITTILSVPLTIQGESVGVLQMTRINGMKPFTEEDVNSLIHLGNLASLAIGQNRLTESNNRLSTLQTTLNQIIESTTFTSSVTDFLETTAEYLTNAMGTSLVLVKANEICGLHGFSIEADYQIGAILQKRGKQFKQTTVVRNLGMDDSGNPDLAGVMKHFGTRAFILAPMLRNNDRIGYICIASQNARDWTIEEIEMVEIATHQVGLAIDGIQSYQEIQSQFDMIKRLTNVTSTINRLAAMEDMIPLIGQGAVSLLNTNLLVLMLRENEKVATSWTFGIDKSDISQIVTEEGATLLNMFNANQYPMLVTDIQRSSLTKHFKNYLITKGIKSIKFVPVIHSGNMIGLIAGLYENIVDWPSRDREVAFSFANTAALALQNVWMFEQIEKSYMDLALNLADAMDARDTKIRTISMRVAEWSQRTANLLGLSKDEQTVIRWAALLHDIGKVEVPDEVLLKTGPLSKGELKVLHHYPVKSERLISPLSHFRKVGTVLHNIRERYDGDGYPDNLKGDKIPMAARIIAVADAYGSMLDSRPYRQALTQEDALKEIKKNSGSQFDPVVVNAFLETVSVTQSIAN
jgi:HD-GYP domain-containing protein (c-di-GMP phosphodiesterase class II)/putative methionine-R-sulfoxide reductase with GAF domain